MGLIDRQDAIGDRPFLLHVSTSRQRAGLAGPAADAQPPRPAPNARDLRPPKPQPAHAVRGALPRLRSLANPSRRLAPETQHENTTISPARKQLPGLVALCSLRPRMASAGSTTTQWPRLSGMFWTWGHQGNIPGCSLSSVVPGMGYDAERSLSFRCSSGVQLWSLVALWSLRTHMADESK